MERLRNALSADAVTRELEVGAKLTDSDAMEEALAECATVTEAAAAGQVRDAAQSMRSSGD
jgi:hypothetical protein